MNWNTDVSAFFAGENTQQRRYGRRPARARAIENQEGFVPETYGIYLTEGAKSEEIGKCDPNQNDQDPDKQPGGNRWPVGNVDPGPSTIGVRSPYNWKSLYNENVHGSGIGSALTYIRYDNEFVGTIFDDVNTVGNLVIDAFGPTGDAIDPLEGNTFTDRCQYTNGPLIGQNFNGQTNIYYNGCFEIPYIFFPRPGHPEELIALDKQQSISTVTVYPNPAVSKIIVASESDIIRIQAVQVGSGRMFAITFKPIGRGEELDVSGLANGVYTLQIELSSGVVENRKLVILH